MKNRIIRKGRKWKLRKKLDAEEWLLLVVMAFIALTVILQVFI